MSADGARYGDSPVDRRRVKQDYATADQFHILSRRVTDHAQRLNIVEARVLEFGELDFNLRSDLTSSLAGIRRDVKEAREAMKALDNREYLYGMGVFMAVLIGLINLIVLLAK
jgi:hypothetical protein